MSGTPPPNPSPSSGSTIHTTFSNETTSHLVGPQTPGQAVQHDIWLAELLNEVPVTPTALDVTPNATRLIGESIAIHHNLDNLLIIPFPAAGVVFLSRETLAELIATNEADADHRMITHPTHCDARVTLNTAAEHKMNPIINTVDEAGAPEPRHALCKVIGLIAGISEDQNGLSEANSMSPGGTWSPRQVDCSPVLEAMKLNVIAVDLRAALEATLSSKH